jgi:hypothetical protein
MKQITCSCNDISTFYLFALDNYVLARHYTLSYLDPWTDFLSVFNHHNGIAAKRQNPTREDLHSSFLWQRFSDHFAHGNNATFSQKDRGGDRGSLHINASYCVSVT